MIAGLELPAEEKCVVFHVHNKRWISFVPPVRIMRRDKKVDEGKLRFVLPTRLGHVELVKDVWVSDVIKALG